MEKEGLVPHNRGFPVSRDFKSVYCNATNCWLYDNNGGCISPSLARIGSDGRCVSYKLKEYKNAKTGD